MESKIIWANTVHARMVDFLRLLLLHLSIVSVAYQRVKKGFVLLPPIHCTAFVRWGVIPYVIIVIKSIHPVFFYFFSCHSFSVSGQLSSSQPAIQPAVNVSSVCVAQDDARRRRRKAGGCCRWRTSTQRPDMNAKCNGTPFSRFIHPCVQYR